MGPSAVRLRLGFTVHRAGQGLGGLGTGPGMSVTAVEIPQTEEEEVETLLLQLLEEEPERLVAEVQMPVEE